MLVPRSISLFPYSRSFQLPLSSQSQFRQEFQLIEGMSPFLLFELIFLLSYMFPHLLFFFPNDLQVTVSLPSQKELVRFFKR